MLKKLLKELMGLAVLAAMVWLAWYGYTNWRAATADPVYSEQGTSFNCRQALARHAEDQAALREDAYALTSEELAAIRRRESDIEQYCN